LAATTERRFTTNFLSIRKYLFWYMANPSSDGVREIVEHRFSELEMKGMRGTSGTTNRHLVKMNVETLQCNVSTRVSGNA
jgi:hypothetical protein